MSEENIYQKLWNPDVYISEEYYVDYKEPETQEQERDRLQAEKRSALIADQAKQEVKEFCKRDLGIPFEPDVYEKKQDEVRDFQPIQNVIVSVENQEESSAVQEIFFKNGIIWVDGENRFMAYSCPMDFAAYAQNKGLLWRASYKSLKSNFFYKDYTEMSAAQFIAAYSNSEQSKTKELDYSKLRPGMKVRIKSWERMEKECDKYSGNTYEYLCHKNSDIPFVFKMKSFCWMFLTIKTVLDGGVEVYEDKGNEWIFPFYSIDLIIENIEKSEKDDVPKAHGKSNNNYNPPKKVKALWLGQTDGDIVIDEFEMLVDNENVGFLANTNHKKYMLNYEPTQVRAVRSRYTASADQPNANGIYYIFESARDLYLWMAEGEK